MPLTIAEILADSGLDASVIEGLAKNDKVNGRIAALVQKQEYDQLLARATALETQGQGAAQYREWYEKNLPAIQKLQQDVARYQERFGSLDEPTKQTTNNAPAGMSKEDVAKVVHEAIQANYAPKWSDLLEGVGTIVQRHVLAGRKTPVDFKKLSEIAAKKGGDLNLAYDEYDAPEREATSKAAMDAEIEKRVQEKLKAERAKLKQFPGDQSANHFDATETRSPLMRREPTNDKGKPVYNRRAVLQAAADPEGEAERQAETAAA